MGLCKCPMKKVTNQFCFEHRVNVCENCLVEEHPKCIVQSYLQWLDDSDYNPVCQLCQEDLPTRECVRLVCYDVFHTACLNEWASKLPANTAPAGYRCPICTAAIFPPSNLVSPVADALRKVLTHFTWAKIGLGLPLVTNNRAPPEKSFSKGNMDDRGSPDGHDVNSTGSIITERYETSNIASSSSSQLRSFYGTNSGISRKHTEPSNSASIFLQDDIELNKYKRRPMMEWFNRWLRTFNNPSSRHHQALIGGRRKMVLMLVILGVCSVIALLSHLSKGFSNDDPMLDPLNNPNIRIEGE